MTETTPDASAPIFTLSESLPWYKKSATKWISLLALVLAVIGIYHCSRAVTADFRLAKGAVDRFHAEFNAGTFGQIYADSAEGLRHHSSEAELVELLAAVQRKLGNVVNSEREQAVSVNNNNGVTTVNLAYQTTFTQGRGEEKFVWEIEGGKALLLNYTINSRDLILK